MNVCSSLPQFIYGLLSLRLHILHLYRRTVGMLPYTPRYKRPLSEHSRATVTSRLDIITMRISVYQARFVNSAHTCIALLLS